MQTNDRLDRLGERCRLLLQYHKQNLERIKELEEQMTILRRQAEAREEQNEA